MCSHILEDFVRQLMDQCSHSYVVSIGHSNVLLFFKLIFLCITYAPTLYNWVLSSCLKCQLWRSFKLKLVTLILSTKTVLSYLVQLRMFRVTIDYIRYFDIYIFGIVWPNFGQTANNFYQILKMFVKCGPNIENLYFTTNILRILVKILWNVLQICNVITKYWECEIVLQTGRIDKFSLI